MQKEPEDIAATAGASARTPEARKETEIVRARRHKAGSGARVRVHSAWTPPALLAGRYRIEHHIASGTMGRVYAATQLPLDRPVAVKILRTSGAMGDPRFRMRFQREASIASQLAHPNIVSIYDYGETQDGDLFMVMELLSGRSLFHVMAEKGPLPIDRALRIAIQVTRALRRAHAQGVVHRDLKPANIMIGTDQDGRDFAKVLDFGLVKMFADESELDGADAVFDYEDDPLTRTGCMVGTPEYVAPEQALGDPVDARADIYSLGVLLYQMIAGKLPFSGSSVLEIVHHHFATEMPPIRERAPGVECPPEVEAIIKKALAKLKDDRYASSTELLGALTVAWQSLHEEAFGTEPSVSVSEIVRRRSFALAAPQSLTEARICEELEAAPVDEISSEVVVRLGLKRHTGRRRLSAMLFGAAVLLAGVAYGVAERRTPRVVIETATVETPVAAPEEAPEPAVQALPPVPAETPGADAPAKPVRAKRGHRYKLNPY